MRTMFILRGLPGSGKSTVAAEMIKKEPGRFIRINRDDLRGMCSGPGNNPHARDDRREELVKKMKDELIKQAFQQGFDVILDDTHLVPMTVKKLHQLAAVVGDVKVVEKGIDVPVSVCIERDCMRTGFAKVGEKVIKDMARASGLDKKRTLENKESYYPPKWTPGGEQDGIIPQFDPALPTTIDSDLDGTASLLNGRSPYDASTCDQDPPNSPVIECIKAMYLYLVAQAKPEHKALVKILFTSGREDKYRAPTEAFLLQHLPGIPYELHMRKTGDMRKDSIIKREMFDNEIRGRYNILFVCDDRNQVVDTWREMGIPCFQVAPGNF